MASLGPEPEGEGATHHNSHNDAPSAFEFGSPATNMNFVRIVMGGTSVVYGSTAVAVFDAFWPQVMGGTTSWNAKPAPAYSQR